MTPEKIEFYKYLIELDKQEKRIKNLPRSRPSRTKGMTRMEQIIAESIRNRNEK